MLGKPIVELADCGTVDEWSGLELESRWFEIQPMLCDKHFKRFCFMNGLKTEDMFGTMTE